MHLADYMRWPRALEWEYVTQYQGPVGLHLQKFLLCRSASEKALLQRSGSLGGTKELKKCSSSSSQHFIYSSCPFTSLKRQLIVLSVDPHRAELSVSDILYSGNGLVLLSCHPPHFETTHTTLIKIQFKNILFMLSLISLCMQAKFFPIEL